MTQFSIKSANEQWRPAFHFSPQRNWINDPNGLFYLDGRYHLYYQYNPTGDTWGNMHWGHASSSDLIHWDEHPVALYAEPDKLGYIFSGSAVVDYHNTAGFSDGSKPAIVAMFTHHSESGVQVQSLAYSNDAGMSWSMYNGNPVISNPGIQNYRDPKVFWYEPGQHWVMAMVAGHCVHFYSSDNLKDWVFLSEFGAEEGAHTGEWECPDLLTLKTTDGDTKWVLLVSINPGGLNGGSATQYFVGEFDGATFTAEHTDVRWFDYGPDNYASVSWSNISAEKPLVTGWMSNWLYANELPTQPWRGAMTLPRELSLVRAADTYLLSNLPVDVFSRHQVHVSDIDLDNPVGKLPDSQLCKIEFDIKINTQASVVIRFENSQHEFLELKYIPKQRKLTLDRRHSGWRQNHWNMVLIEADVLINFDHLQGTIILDKSSIEIFCQQGTSCMTANFFPTEPLSVSKICAPSVDEIHMKVYELKSGKTP